MSEIVQPNSAVRRNEPQKVFVYGTLKEGFGNHRGYLTHSKKLGEAQLDGIMFHLGGYPAINLSEHFCKIKGEVYLCEWDDILAMDRLEGHPDFYTRVEVKLPPQYAKAWTYVMPRDKVKNDWEVIPSGEWRGTTTPRVKWEGWGKGIHAGSFQTAPDEIKVGPGTSPFVLRKNGVTDLYDLINRNTGEVIGRGYKYLREMVDKNGKTKPVLGIPAKTVIPVKTVEDMVKETVYKQAAGPHTGLPALPGPTEYKAPESQPARLLGLPTKAA